MEVTHLALEFSSLVDMSAESTPELPTREGYDRWSGIYDEYPNPLIALETPQVRRLLGQIEEWDLLDVGCGTGRHAIGLAQAGARVTAIDFSDGMLEQARQKEGAQGVRFMRHDLNQPLPFEDRSFDRILHCLVLDHLASPKQLMHEFARLLRPGGRAIISVMHPAMYLKNTQARFVDPASGDLVLIENEQYSISDYVMAVHYAGLEMEVMTEHSCDAELAERIPRAEKYVDWPMLLMMRLRALLPFQ